MMTTESTSKPLYTISNTRQHTIYRTADRKRVPGVTTVLGVINKPQLLKWAHQCGLDGEDFNKVRDKAADIGTIGHAMVEAHLRGMELDTSNLNPDHVSQAENAFLKFLSWWDAEGFEVLETEVVLVSEVWRCGGTADIIARDRQGRIVLVDLKTGKGIYDEHLVQTSAYAEFYEENYQTPVDKIVICRIGREECGDFEPREVHNRPAQMLVFEYALGLYKARQAAGHR